jgi:hypothetical protein
VGTGRNCIESEAQTACPAGVTAVVCQDVTLRMALRWPDARIKGRLTAHEIWRCVDSACATLRIHERWSGHVTRATGRFGDLAGGRISGGGILIVDANTFAVFRVDTTGVIHAGDD